MYVDHGTYIQRDDGACIPLVAANSDYAAYLDWVAVGNTAPLAPTQVVIPQQVTMRQARLALLAAGKIDLVDAAIASLSSPEREIAHIEWEYGAVVDRASPVVEMLAAALALDLDELFTRAATL